ncbi:MAG: hypothetical protein MUC88_00515 [Planctomycetes bacterium]|jgi:hypothetical protein|nr:hypothetical protein [Planctomycetota bacterium]
MPYTPTVPPTETVAVATEKELDKYQILSLCLTLPPDTQAATLVVKWCKGWVDENDAYHVGQVFEDTISGTNLDAAFASQVSGGLYEVVKAKLWDLMATEGLVGTGATS